MAYRLQAGVLALGLCVSGCATPLKSERSEAAVELARPFASAPEARLWHTETMIQSDDGMQSRAVRAVSIEVTDLINRAFVEQLRHRSEGWHSFSVVVPADEGFGRPVTYPGSNLIPSETAAVLAAAAPAGEWTVGLRNVVEYNVFSDTVELQLATVMTIYDPQGVPQWQAAARSQKYYDNWGGGEHLAALSAKFVMDSVRENVRQLKALAQ